MAPQLGLAIKRISLGKAESTVTNLWSIWPNLWSLLLHASSSPDPWILPTLWLTQIIDRNLCKLVQGSGFKSYPWKMVVTTT